MLCHENIALASEFSLVSFASSLRHLLSRGHELICICSHQRPLPEQSYLRVLRYQEPPSMEGTFPTALNFGMRHCYEPMS